MKCPYSPENYLKGDYEVRAVTMKEQRTTGGELKKMQYHTCICIQEISKGTL